MKKLMFVAVCIALLAAGSASAQCVTITNGGGPAGLTWYMYQISKGCWNALGNLSNANVGCSGDNGWQVGLVWSPPASIYASVVAQSGKVYNPAHWNVEVYWQTVSPDQSWWDYIDLTVTVTHPDLSQTIYSSLLHWNGTMASNDGCHALITPYFTANVGDTITMKMTSSNMTGNSTIITGVPRLVNYN